MSPKVAVIVLNWNNFPDTRDCVNSLAGQTYDNYQVFIIDNGSTDGSFDLLSREFPDTPVVNVGWNSGYAGGNNFGIQHAMNGGFDIFLVLNNDLCVGSATLLEAVVIAMGQEATGIVGPRLEDYNDPTWRLDDYWGSRFYRLLDYFVAKTPCDEWCAQDYHLVRVNRVSGAAIAVSRPTIEAIGSFDDGFFLYCEENDLCFRASKAGIRIVHVDDPKACVRHKAKHVTDVPNYQWYYLTRNEFFLVSKLLAGSKRALMTLFLASIVPLNRFFALLRGRSPDRLRRYLKYSALGMFDAFTGRSGYRDIV